MDTARREWSRGAGIAGELKPYQLQTAVEVGFSVPRTLITNDPTEVLDFFDRCSGQMIYKPFGEYLSLAEVKRFPSGSTRETIFTNVVIREDLLRQLDQIKGAPCIFQEYVPKKFELRITIVGSRIFPAQIDSQASERSKHDWRRYDFEKTPYSEFQIPAVLEDKLRMLMQRLGLVFGCVDLIMRPDGEFVFLEINPGGQWLWIEELTGMPIRDSLALMLMQGTPDYEVQPVSIRF